MKCIQMKDGEMKKVKNGLAVDLVFEKKANYLPKNKYKASKGKGAAKTEAEAGSKNQSKKSKKARKDSIN